MQDIMVVLNLKKRNYHLQKLKQMRQRRLCRRKRSCWNIRGRTEEWWSKMITGELSSENWKKNFRFSLAAFMNLVDELRPYITPSPLSPNQKALSAEKKLAITLYYLKDTGSLNITANTFGVANYMYRQFCNTSSLQCYIYPSRTQVSSFATKYRGNEAESC